MITKKLLLFQLKILLLLISLLLATWSFSGCCLLPNANWHTYINGYDAALRSGNSTESIRYAKILLKTDKSLYDYITHQHGTFEYWSEQLGIAYELGGDYELAREQYRASANYDCKSVKECLIGRTYYKQKLYHESFIAYCNGSTENLNDLFRKEHLREWILCKSHFADDEVLLKRFYPFASYFEFIQFIESEYQKLSEKEKEQYKNSVEKLRQIASEFTTEQLHEDIRIPRK
jgi:succinate dehydrogenase flavin-adding protein (antitoxin of CptAB toxin-antitoxin module)